MHVLSIFCTITRQLGEWDGESFAETDWTWQRRGAAYFMWRGAFNICLEHCLKPCLCNDIHVRTSSRCTKLLGHSRVRHSNNCVYDVCSWDAYFFMSFVSRTWLIQTFYCQVVCSIKDTLISAIQWILINPSTTKGWHVLNVWNI